MKRKNKWTAIRFQVLGLFIFLSGNVHAGSAGKTLFMSEDRMMTVGVSLGRSTVLNFPIKPNKVILGDAQSFAIEYVENDLAISAIRPGVATNLFVYMHGRRFGFNLMAVPRASADVLFVRDTKDKNIEYEVKK